MVKALKTISFITGNSRGRPSPRPWHPSSTYDELDEAIRIASFAREIIGGIDQGLYRF